MIFGKHKLLIYQVVRCIFYPNKRNKIKILQRRVKSTIRINITQLKLQNQKEGDITLHHIAIISMCCRVIQPSFYFCNFSYVLYIVLTRRCKLLSFSSFIFAVLLLLIYL